MADDKITGEKKWYIVQAYSGYEKYVVRALKERIANSEYGAYFGEILVPTEEVVELKGGKKRKTERKFFPGYVLVNMELNEGAWMLVRETPRVLGFVGGTAERPAPMSDEEAANILQRMEDTAGKPRPKVLYEVGEVVRIIDGPFADFTGAIEEINYDKNRLRVAVLIFGRSTPVELNFSQVEKS